MRLSEAMMLGSTTCRMQAGDWNSCALGAAANAMRLPRDFNFSFGGVRYESYLRIREIASMWPWLDIAYRPDMFEEQPDSPGRKIYQLFDHEVCENEMTFEQLVDYVRTIEPECGECNQYECSCQESSRNGPHVLTDRNGNTDRCCGTPDGCEWCAKELAPVLVVG